MDVLFGGANHVDRGHGLVTDGKGGGVELDERHGASDESKRDVVDIVPKK
jgi:hypothetical protein